MTITARNIGRINVWPTYDVAREADTAECEFIGQLTVWRTADEARANMTHEEEGGGDEPLIFIDFVNNTATNDGATVAIDTLVGNDPNADSFSGGTTGYNPANLTADGYVPVGSSPAYIGDAKDMVLAGCTIVRRLKQVGASPGSSRQLQLGSLDGADAVLVSLETPSQNLGGFSFNGPLDVQTAAVLNIGVGAVNVAAATVVSDRIDVALNGSAAATSTLTEQDRPPGNPFVAVLEAFSAATALQSISIYAALPDTSGLSELSEI